MHGTGAEAAEKEGGMEGSLATIPFLVMPASQPTAHATNDSTTSLLPSCPPPLPPASGRCRCRWHVLHPANVVAAAATRLSFPKWKEESERGRVASASMFRMYVCSVVHKIQPFGIEHHQAVQMINIKLYYHI